LWDEPSRKWQLSSSRFLLIRHLAALFNMCSCTSLQII
jgi:hypothetical protein